MNKLAASPSVLVTGGPGFIGRRVVARFLDAGWGVSSFSLPGESSRTEWRGPVTMYFGDLAEAGALDSIQDAFDVVVHLAAPVGLAGEYQRQWRMIVDGTARVCEAAARWRARVVVASSVAVYGDRIQSQACTEDTAHGAWQGAYGRAKQGQEKVALEWAERHSLPLTIVRPANVYGLGGSSAWGDRFIAAIRATGGGVVGEGERNDAGLVYVENLADAIWLAATEPAAVGRTYNVCDEVGVTWRGFIDDMAKLAGMPSPPAIPLEPLLTMARANEDPAAMIAPRDPNVLFLEVLNLIGFDNRFDASRIRRELGWAPRYSNAQALAEMGKQYPSTAITDTAEGPK